MDSLKGIDANIIGFIVNDVNSETKRYYSYYRKYSRNYFYNYNYSYGGKNSK